MKKESFQKLVLTGVFAALSYVVFTFLQIKIPLPGGDATSIHLGNAVCVLGALILDKTLRKELHSYAPEIVLRRK